MSNPPPPKRARFDASAHNDEDSDAHNSSSFGEEESDDTDDEISALKPQKSKQTMKRKLRATAPSNFGVTLQSLLNTEAPSDLPLSLKPSLARQRNDEKLEIKAKKVLHDERKEKEDQGRVTDVIGGWGAEGERALRKVAQRGVVKLFNVIQQTQAEATAIEEDTKKSRGTGKATLSAPSTGAVGKGAKKPKGKDNELGRGKEAMIDKSDFFDMLRSGGLVSKA